MGEQKIYPWHKEWYQKAKGIITYQTRCRPFGMALTQLTGPLPLGNFNDRSDTQPELAL